jgi:hypothetical protein
VIAVDKKYLKSGIENRAMVLKNICNTYVKNTGNPRNIFTVQETLAAKEETISKMLKVDLTKHEPI